MIVPHDAGPSVHACAEAWAAGLRERGLDVHSAGVSAASPAAALVIVEPHAALLPLAGDPLRIAGLLRHAVCVSTSRYGSRALAADRPFQAAAAASVACSRDSARHLSAQGIPTAHLKPGSHARLCAPRTESRTVAFGAHARPSAFRDDVLARARDTLGSTAVHPPEQLEADEWLAWLTRVDVLASLPPEPGPGIDWCEVVPAVMNGAVVLTTAESDFGPLEPGVDLATATGAGFADALRRLLADDERRVRMRESARARLLEHPLDVAPLAAAIAAVAESARRPRPFVVPASAA